MAPRYPIGARRSRSHLFPVRALTAPVPRWTVRSHRCRSRTVESDSSKSDSDGNSSWLSGPASPNSPSYTPSPRNSSPSRPADACPTVDPDFEPNRGEAAAPAMLTLFPGATFPVAALGSEGGEWLSACLPTLSTTLGEPCTVLCQARVRDVPCTFAGNPQASPCPLCLSGGG